MSFLRPARRHLEKRFKRCTRIGGLLPSRFCGRRCRLAGNKIGERDRSRTIPGSLRFPKTFSSTARSFTRATTSRSPKSTNSIKGRLYLFRDSDQDGGVYKDVSDENLLSKTLSEVAVHESISKPSHREHSAHRG